MAANTKGGLKRDSVEKIKMYLSNLERPVILSPLFFRDYTCPPACGGCCPRFSLDFIADSQRWNKFKELYPHKLHHFKERTVDGVKFMSDTQEDHKDHFCRNLDKATGRCEIHESNPFTCEFELMKLQTLTTKEETQTLLINKLFGRGWSYTRIDGEKGALCEMKGFSFEKYKKDLALLKELQEMADKFGSKGNLPDIINYLEANEYKFKDGLVPTNKVKFTKTKNQNELWM